MKFAKNVFLLCAALPVGCFAAKEIKASKGNLTYTPDYLLILGCRVKGNEAQDILKSRIDEAASYLLKHSEVKAICCGGIVHEDQSVSEAQVIYESLLSAGIEKERLILEDKSQTTEENFINAKRIIGENENNQETKIAFLSSEFHLMRASYIAKNVGLNCGCVPSKTPLKKRIGAYIREAAVYPVAILKK